MLRSPGPLANLQKPKGALLVILLLTLFHLLSSISVSEILTVEIGRDDVKECAKGVFAGRCDEKQ